MSTSKKLLQQTATDLTNLLKEHGVEAELTNILQIYMRRLNEETSKSIAFEARIVQLINQVNTMQEQLEDKKGSFKSARTK